ncbi:hypothetical protein GIB67_039075 [Kingdonia uniflora]|uniref:Uncharacterized protein n=1 Tax=Kingdonia uniflora TaxID=39325 RepID=A0A7J7LL60_9MAGN|nr:hypothetical protein GIB67_039075 [Kingdonia uniflora]
MNEDNVEAPPMSEEPQTEVSQKDIVAPIDNTYSPDRSFLLSFKFHRAKSIYLGQEPGCLRVYHHASTWHLDKEPSIIRDLVMLKDKANIKWSWGSAVLAHLLHNLGAASQTDGKQFVAYTTLLERQYIGKNWANGRMAEYAALVRQCMDRFPKKSSIAHYPQGKNRHADALTYIVAMLGQSKSRTHHIEVLECPSIDQMELNAISTKGESLDPDDWQTPFLAYFNSLPSQMIPKPNVRYWKTAIETPFSKAGYTATP